MDGSVTVRRAETGDVGALAGLKAQVQEFHRAHEPAVFKPAGLAEVSAWFAACLEADQRVWVATASGGLVGYVSVLPQAREEHVFCRARTWWEVDQIAVRPEWRRRGVARALLGAVATDAMLAGVSRLQLSSWAFNHDAQKAFRHLGFEPQATRFEADARQLAR